MEEERAEGIRKKPLCKPLSQSVKAELSCASGNDEPPRSTNTLDPGKKEGSKHSYERPLVLDIPGHCP